MHTSSSLLFRQVRCRALARARTLSTSGLGNNNEQMTKQLLRDTGATIPVFCGPMYPGSNPELVAEVSRCGGMGIVQPLALTHLYGHDFREGLRLIRKLSDGKPFGVNFTIMPQNKKYQNLMDEWMHISCEEGVKFFLTSLGKPNDIVKFAHDHDIKVYHDVHTSELARRAVGAGVDGLNLLNSSMGGQTGTFEAMEFLQDVQALDLNVPLLCAGGVGDEQSFLCALERGYAGVQMGTRFLATHECQVTNSYKQGIVAASSEDIVLTNKLAGTESSVIRTPMVEAGGLRVNAFLSYLLRQSMTKSYARMFLLSQSVNSYKKATFDETHQVWQAGKGVSDIKEVEHVAAILKRFQSVLHAADESKS